MDATFIIAIGLIALIILVLLTLFGVLLYSGLITKITVGAGKPPIENVTIAYKFGRGPYKNTGELFTEVTSIAPQQRCIGIYYDDPQQVSRIKIDTDKSINCAVTLLASISCIKAVVV